MKTSVIIVDDEPIAAKAIAFIIKNQFPELEISGVFHSGREAVRNTAQLHPDIAIMDIQMPGIDGLEAMRQIRAQNSLIRFIIISAHNNFNYAVEAISLDTSDYLLKPVRKKEFAACLRKVLADINTRKEKMENSLEQQERMKLIAPVVIKDFIYSFQPNANQDEHLIVCANFLGYLNKNGYVLVAEEDTCEGDGVFLQDFINHLKCFVPCVADIVQKGLAAAYIPAEGSLIPDGYMEKLTEWLPQMQKKSYPHNSRLYVGIGNIYKGALQARQSCSEAFQAVKVLRNECNFQTGIHFLHIRNAMHSNHFNAVEIQNIEALDTAAEANKIVEKADRYMKQNYAQDITLENVARHVNLSPCYFCRFYKEYAGINYSDMLLRIRMEKAKELLKKNSSSIKETAYSVGFKDPNYFSKVFKKETGMTASEYKTKYQEQ